MHHPQPMEDFILVACKGYCGAFTYIPFSKLHHTLLKSGRASLTEYRNSHICGDCFEHFVVLVCDLPAPQPINWDDVEDIKF
jgi:hypothetical protein